MSDLVCPGYGGTECGLDGRRQDFTRDECGGVRSSTRQARGQSSMTAAVGQQGGKQEEQVGDGKHEQALSRQSIVILALAQLHRERDEDAAAGKSSGAIDRASKPKCPRQDRDWYQDN